MTEYRHSATADIPADELFAFLSHPENLPRYFPEMKVAEPKGRMAGVKVGSVDELVSALKGAGLV